MSAQHDARLRAVNADLVAALELAISALESARQEFYDSAHSSGDPSDESMMTSDAIEYRKCANAAIVARSALARARSTGDAGKETTNQGREAGKDDRHAG